ncbi:conserved hypothetical protein [Vibrio crassostreae]|uniref:Uncharacterized protein n=1 Tax=Vibrio tasmaniensis 1F-267 TaxID=1191324 RepID=A0ABX3BBX2_9VIBR|nr:MULTISPECIES: hypothetical protein [Vibrio]OEF51762.1 hypothetical protein A163_04270 [Vibrio tasmaniensis 1F-267]PMO99321.1 hypothetical protein BCS97_06825 [Vibrio splendidus]PMP28592.1 hypothetical protein BCS88_02310 [Vibrio splendidus]PMP35245.1 hypothetical protein BCS89_00695 [Vibrio splendidus]PMP39105.1 hypothetical protein BCS87_11625 [Vibrio splendidus]
MPINYLYIDDEKTEILQTLIEAIERESEDAIKIHHTQVLDTISAYVLYIQANEDDIQGIIVDQDLKAESDIGNKADYFGTTVAQQLRTEMALSSIKALPIILLSNEEAMVESFEPDDSSKNLFDYVVKKKEVANSGLRPRIVAMLQALHSAYSIISRYKKGLGTDLSKVEIQTILDCHTEIFGFIDSRLLDYLSSKASDPHALVNAIYTSLVQSAGILVTENMLLTKLGLSSESSDWESLKSNFECFRYTGPFSNLKERWWLSGIEDWWYNLHPDEALQSLTCKERVSLLKSRLELEGLKPIPPNYPNGEQSGYLWVNCVLSGVALDTHDALRVRDTEAKPWEQPKYIDLRAHLNDEDNKYKIHQDDRSKVKLLLARLKPDVNE